MHAPTVQTPSWEHVQGAHVDWKGATTVPKLQSLAPSRSTWRTPMTPRPAADPHTLHPVLAHMQQPARCRLCRLPSRLQEKRTPPPFEPSSVFAGDWGPETPVSGCGATGSAATNCLSSAARGPAQPTFVEEASWGPSQWHAVLVQSARLHRHRGLHKHLAGGCVALHRLCYPPCRHNMLPLLCKPPAETCGWHRRPRWRCSSLLLYCHPARQLTQVWLDYL